MTEVRIVPRVRTETQAIKSPVSKCGDNWFSAVKIRSPYKKTDIAYRTLPSLGDPSQIENFEEGFIEEIRGDHERITAFVQENARALTPRQQANIRRMLGRAARYLIDARAIAMAWSTGFATTSAGTIPAWPLGGRPNGAVNDLMEEGYHRDQEKYKQLLRASLRNLRCAEEVAKRSTIRARNKMRSRGRAFANIAEAEYGPIASEAKTASINPAGGKTASINPMDATDSGFDATATPSMPPPIDGEDDELEDGDIVLDETAPDPAEDDAIQEEAPIEEPTKPAKGKKKDNTLLIAGAAALGFMALKGR